MLHELLLALSGDSGGVFVYKKFAGLQVAADLPFIHRSEVDLLNRICKLGSYFQKFQTFCRKYSEVSPFIRENPNDGATQQEPFGLYIQAFCTGLDQVLDSYRKSLIDLESQILEDPKLPLTYIEHSLEQYQVLFPALWSVVEQIQASKALGCQILDILHQSCNCGIPDVRDALERILFVCHGVMYQQLSAWVLHGIHIDKHNEFFIKEATSADDQTVNKTDEGAASSSSDLGIPGITGRQLTEILEGEVKKQTPARWQFRINAEMLPSYIPTRVADKVLFIGESVGMFKGSKETKNSLYRSSVIQDKEQEFTRLLYSLQQQPKFNLMLFENEIDKIRLCVAEHLWKLVVEDVNLLKQLQILKDFFLLGRGELFSAFIEHARSLLKLPPSDNTSHDANAAFLQVLSKFLPDDDESASMFNVVIDKEMIEQEKKKKTTTTDQPAVVVSGWDCVKLQYDVQWPLHILFQPTVLEKYNNLFRFLLKVKRTQLDLQQVWAAYMGTKHLSTAQLANMTKIWLSRMHMAFLVDNLQYYLQVDVLETQFSQLVEKINSTRDFESIRLAHDHFITTLMAQSFLLMKPVSHCLDEILNLCQSFSSLLLQTGSTGLTQRELTQIENITKTYERQTVLLFQILSSVRSHQASPHLAQLLLRIDFNKHFSSSSTTTISSSETSASF
ncbi:Gamma-tubulin complex component 4 [Desmophyllum pertusum]|uniref:Gamma-tubulin complex component n=1 Tax=Desmophyllum pertusum TaxID=174260 RepID=A0A9X0D8G9_9CNID|nr:Gamma-tubulin complex component 4 [Desmophyllum pertusum]